MFSKVMSAGLDGVDSYLVRVEADVSDGLPQLLMVGYLAAEVREAADRVRTSLRNVGYTIPPKRITVNLAPAGVRKAGTRYDLPIAAAVLAAMGEVPQESLMDLMIVGELSLSGQILSVTGVLSLVEAARGEGIKRCIVPAGNACEGAVLNGIDVIGVSDLPEFIDILRNPEKAIPAHTDAAALFSDIHKETRDDFAQINGQRAVRRAAEVAAAGMHNLLMIGPPGSGKTMIARRMPGILPRLSLEESLEITKIYSVAGKLPEDVPLITERPFRAPHHTATPEALAGGGRQPTPGEISLSTCGVLFLDEIPEFKRAALEILRQPLEEGCISIARTVGTYTYPARFMLVAAMNPCACGFFPDRSRCRCAQRDVERYLGRLSQPLLDRIDVCTEAPRISYDELTGGSCNESTADIRVRVERAHRIQHARYEGLKTHFNAELNGAQTERFCRLGDSEQKLIRAAFDTLSLSARAYHRTIRVARTIADLDGAEHIEEKHILEALGYRPPDRNEWIGGYGM